jgi:two-component system, NarL family, response regulator DesR
VIRVLLAEDEHLIRGALLALIGLEDDMQVVGELDRGDLIVETAKRVRPDVAVLDIDLPGLDGLSAASVLRDEMPETRVLILTGLGGRHAFCVSAVDRLTVTPGVSTCDS